MDRGAWLAMVHSVAELDTTDAELDTTEATLHARPSRWYPELPATPTCCKFNHLWLCFSTLVPRTAGTSGQHPCLSSAPSVADWKLATLSTPSPYSLGSPREIQAPTGVNPTPSRSLCLTRLSPFSLRGRRAYTHCVPSSLQSSFLSSVCPLPGILLLVSHLVPFKNQPESSLWWACLQAPDKVGVPHPGCQPLVHNSYQATLSTLLS